MEKQQLYRIWKKVRPVRPVYLLLASCLMFGVFILAYRQNNLVMLQLRNEVFVADEQGGDVETALKNLRQHVYGHMNTDLTPKPDSIRPPIQLKHRYDRLVSAEKERVSKLNEKVYTEAQAECERRIPTGRIADRVPCVEEYVRMNTVKEQPIPDAMYKFDFVSPVWSRDLAGYSLLASVVLLLLTAVSFTTRSLLRRSLRTHA